MTWHPWGDGVVLRPSGDLLEGPVCDDLEQTLERLLAQGRRVIVSLAQTGQLSAHALGVLAHARALSDRNGGRLGLCSAHDHHRWLLQVTRLTPALGLYDTEAAAYAALSRPRNGVAGAVS